MRIARLLAVASLAAVVLAIVPATAQADPVHYYVALGDSLAVGYQPGLGDTGQGYADQLYPTLKAKDPALVLVKLGCSGETTGTMINGGRCTDGRYPAGSQLNEAVAFLAAHGADVKYLTVDIGANDVDGCTPGGSIDPVCLAQGVLTIESNLPTILSRLRAADANLPRSVGMTYYDPFLEYWLHGVQGQLVATASVGLLATINTAEIGMYNQYGFAVADVQGAYKTASVLPFTTVAPYGSLPTNVATICRLTYMCSVQNIHPNPAGYGVIAQAFAAKIS
jgi:lysophospholipase L1-like esterase